MKNQKKTEQQLNSNEQPKDGKLRTTVRAGVSLWGVGWWPQPVLGPN
jgi:hypothetical protein